MFNKLSRAAADPARPATATPEEDSRKVVAAFFLALVLYLGVSFGALAQEKLELDATLDAQVVLVDRAVSASTPEPAAQN